MIRYGICLLSVVLAPLTAFAQFASSAALTADILAGRAIQVDGVARYDIYGGTKMIPRDELPKGKLYLTGLSCSLGDYGPTQAVGTLELVGPFRSRSGQPVAMYAGPIGYHTKDPIVLQENFADPLYYDNSDGKRGALLLRPLGFIRKREHAYLACGYSVVVYDKSSPTPNPGRVAPALRTMYLKLSAYDSVDNMSYGNVLLPAGKYILKNISCRGSVANYSGWNVGVQGNAVWDMPASFGSDGSFQINYNSPGLRLIQSPGSGDSSRLYVSLQGRTKNTECSVSLEQYGWK
jgi:hypothetical protein